METKKLVTIILGIIGTLCFGIGMSLALVPEFSQEVTGIIIGAIGLAVVLSIIPIWFRPRKISFSLVVTYVIGIVGALLLGVSLSYVLTETTLELSSLMQGLLYGIPGLLIIAFNPVVFVARQRGKLEKGGEAHV